MRCNVPRRGVDYFMSEVKPKAEPRAALRPFVFSRPALLAGTYVGPKPKRDHAKVCLSQSTRLAADVNSGNQEKT